MTFRLVRNSLVLLIAIVLSTSLYSNAALAHLMVAQKGTLNIVDNKVYMVLSVPISAFDGLDTNDDGRVSMIEFNKQRGKITETINERVSLSDSAGDFSLNGLRLLPSLEHHDEIQLVIMGIFQLKNEYRKLRFSARLFGTGEAQQRLEITAKDKAQGISQSFVLSPAEYTQLIF